MSSAEDDLQAIPFQMVQAMDTDLFESSLQVFPARSIGLQNNKTHADGGARCCWNDQKERARRIVTLCFNSVWRTPCLHVFTLVLEICTDTKGDLKLGCAKGNA